MTTEKTTAATPPEPEAPAKATPAQAAAPVDAAAAELAAIHASLAEQAATVQEGPPHRRIPRREVQPDGTPKSNPVLRRRAARKE